MPHLLVTADTDPAGDALVLAEELTPALFADQHSRDQLVELEVRLRVVRPGRQDLAELDLGFVRLLTPQQRIGKRDARVDGIGLGSEGIGS